MENIKIMNKSQQYSILLFIIFLALSVNVKAQNKYKHVFNPMKGLVHESETPFREELCLNGKWQFMPVFKNDLDQFKKPLSFDWDAVPLKVPSPWNINSFAEGDGGDFLTFPSYPKAWEKAKIGWMKKDFVLPKSWSGKQIKLHFEAIAGFAKIYINGQLAGENLDIFFPTELDVTSFVKPGKNEILVGVAKASLTDDQGKYGRRNYVAGSFWGQHIVGIWQDVSLIAVPELSITNVFVNPDVRNDVLEFSVSIQNNTTRNQSFILNASIREWLKEASDDVNMAPVDNGFLKDEIFQIKEKGKIELKAGGHVTLVLTKKVNGSLKYWTPETPNLYGLVISLKKGKKKVADIKYTRFGWRQFTINGTELLLNGKAIVLKGDSWHFMGIPQMTRRYAWAWFKMLKDANANAVRLHAQPYPSFYLDMADEMGICVLDETGIWSSDGGPKMDSDDYWEYCKKHVKSLVMRDRNHPSIFGWSVCNETLPVAIHVFHAPESIVQRQVDEINNWVAIVKETDPTRDWISGDGEDMRPTDLTTVIGHYGDENSMKKWSSEGKPWGVGETGMAYYGTPKQMSGRPYNLSYAAEKCKAILVNWLPGQEGGPATADVLFGNCNPAGRLPMTFPRHVGQLPLYYNFKTSGRGYNYVDMDFTPLYSFGYGLSYTKFNYSNLKINQKQDGSVEVQVTVTNIGDRDGDEVVQLYVTDMYSSVKTRVMELKDFTRVPLASGESRNVQFLLTPYQLSLLNDKMDRVVESGEFKIMLGGHSPLFVAADRIKDSVGFETSEDGLTTMLNYNQSFQANFGLSFDLIDQTSLSGETHVFVKVKNTGNLTDVGKLKIYVDGTQQEEVHHYELGPDKSKIVQFKLDGKPMKNIMVASKYKCISINY